MNRSGTTEGGRAPASDAAQTEIETLRAERDRALAIVAGKDRQIEQLTAGLVALHKEYRSSRSWRITWPFRAVSKLVRFLFSKVRRGEALHAAPQRLADRVAPLAPRATAQAATASARDAHRAALAKRLGRFMDQGKRLALPVSAEPDVSIIVVAYNQAELVFSCLESIRDCLSGSSLGIETIVWDNGSDSQTRDLLQSSSGIRWLRSEENLHFLRGVNQAAEEARGRFLLLLNSDAELTPGSLEHAVRRLEDDETIGAIGGRLILPDGTLQEAGSIIWNDGTCAAYAAGARPDRPDVMFRRDVDYCSGAFLVTPRRLFEEMGRFDERYAPAYYEETDYCVRLWKRGYRVAYDPAIVTHHFEFGSSATRQDALDLQQRNHGLFRETHADWLSGRRSASPSGALVARDAGPRRPRVLYVDDRVPHVDLGSGYPRAKAIVDQLVELGAQVTLFPMFSHVETWPEVWRTLSADVETMLDAHAATLDAFLAERPDFYDLVVISRPHNMQVVAGILKTRPDAFGRARIVYDAEAIFARREELKRRVERGTSRFGNAERALRDEIDLTRWADLILAVSNQERALFVAETDKPVHVLGHALLPDAAETSFSDRSDIVFLGPAHDDETPNADSLRWFAGSILPEIREKLGASIRLKVIGSVSAPSIRALEGTDVDLLGRIDDLKPVLARARMIVIPTRFAAGIPHKAHHAAALGVPIVTTDLIRGQLEWENGRDLLASDDALEFAGHCCALYTDAALWRRLRDNALQRVAADCSPDRFRDELAEVLRLAQAKASHGAAPKAKADRCLAVPFSWVPAVALVRPKAAAVIHAYYDDMAPLIRSYLDNVPGPLDLFISTDTAEKVERISAAFSGWSKGTADIRVFPNRGRDIAPKLVGFRDVYDRYELVLFLHSKASFHNDALAGWRDYLMDHLAGSPATVASILDIFRADPGVGMVAPQHFDAVRPFIGWGPNFEKGSALAARFGVRVSPEEPLDFPSGSMFWARSAALRPLLDLGLGYSDFGDEQGRTDGQLEHAVERLFFLSCRAAGFKPVKVALPGRSSDTGVIDSVASRVELLDWLDAKVQDFKAA